MNIKDTFNWLVEKPQNNFTLGEAWQRHVQKKPAEEINPTNKLGFTRVGRITERAFLLSGVAKSALMAGVGVLVIPAAPIFAATLVVASVFNLAAAKVVGVVAGKLVDFMAKGINGILQSPKQSKAKQAAPQPAPKA